VIPPRLPRRLRHLADPTPGQLARLARGFTGLWVARQAPAPIQPVAPGRLGAWLGREVETLVFDARPAFDANALAMALGLVRGGGRLVLLTPPLAQWSESRFSARLSRLLEVQFPAPPAAPAVEGPYTPDQARAARWIERTALGHSRRPLLITADRGRGKSALLGMAAARLLDARHAIVVTAPRPQATAVLFRHARAALNLPETGAFELETGGKTIRFVAPDALLRDSVAADLVLVDEAAGLPLPMIEALVRRHNRLVLATTVHGYEGSGRGFVTRLAGRLDQLRPGWRQISLTEPVRWAPGDPLESWGNHALLLDAEPGRITGPPPSDPAVVHLDRDRLARSETLLRGLFGLLASAHYRTEPRDFQLLLDQPGLEILAVLDQESPLAVALVAREGRLAEDRQRAILVDGRRPHGHLLPQVLATRCGLPEALGLDCRRIVRIAVHPRLQGRGLGTRLLAAVTDHARETGADLVGASFGATVPLVRFWRRAGWLPLRLGHRREASSGAHALVMARALTPRLQAPLKIAADAFQEAFVLQLAEHFQSLEAELVLTIRACAPPPPAPDAKRLAAFARGRLPFLDALPALHALALGARDPGDRTDRLLVMKLLQHRDWQSCARALDLPGRKAMEKLLRERAQRHHA